MDTKKHYGKKYFEEYQEEMAKFGGRLSAKFFKKYISPNDKVLDFGCGGGTLLENIPCKEKWGIEINNFAAKKARERGINIKKDVKNLKDSYFDVIISYHALEHTECPLKELIEIYKKLKNNGKIVFMFPHELKGKYKEREMSINTFILGVL
jgi:2-polyprenyl-3-methyl-5-hydroxy-6-metoxy-1,4-benzoquinol methylase